MRNSVTQRLATFREQEGVVYEGEEEVKSLSPIEKRKFRKNIDHYRNLRENLQNLLSRHKADDPLEELIYKEDAQKIEEVFESADPEILEITKKYLGLDPYEERHSITEIMREYGLTRQVVWNKLGILNREIMNVLDSRSSLQGSYGGFPVTGPGRSILL